MRRIAVVAIVGIALVVLSTTFAYAIPSLQLSSRQSPVADNSADQGAANSSAQATGSRFGTTLAPQQASSFTRLDPVGAGGRQHDNYKRAQFERDGQLSEVPEPSSLWLLSAGLGLMLLLSVRKRQTL